MLGRKLFLVVLEVMCQDHPHKNLRFFILPKSDFGVKMEQMPTIRITQAQKINRVRYRVKWRLFF